MTIWHSVILEERTEKSASADHWSLSGTWDNWKSTYDAEKHVNDLYLQVPLGTHAVFTGIVSG